ncbi:MAG TPA: septum formation initiator family protein [Blastocatellia bacterium]|nr:septum formation initiator family protein [Blastocatellia bacterium]
MSQAANAYRNNRNPSLFEAKSIIFSNIRSRRLSVALVVIGVLLAVAACYSFHRQTQAELDIAIAKKQAEAARVRNLQIEVQRVQEEINSLETDPRVIEALARQSLGFVRPGDVIVKATPAEADQTQRTQHR